MKGKTFFFCQIKNIFAYNIMGEEYMQKKLPKVFANSLGEVHNNTTVFYSADNHDLNSDRSFEEKESVKKLKGTTVTQKINEIFNSPYYIYKAEVDITLDSGKVTKKIIGKNQQNLITMENEVIPIETIRDIEFK